MIDRLELYFSVGLLFKDLLRNDVLKILHRKKRKGKEKRKTMDLLKIHCQSCSIW